MSAQITETPPPVEDAQRRGHIAALAVAEQIVAISPIVPTDVRASCLAVDDAPSVDVHFFRSPEGVEALAEVLGGVAITRPFRESDPRPYTAVDLVVDGVPVLAWSLGTDDAAAVAA